ncbi:MAG: adenylyltransferase/cytidyltransferase family protein [bacterium]|nr:adenylyltransferase/cytidyltransferase family protein [bacterium]
MTLNKKVTKKQNKNPKKIVAVSGGFDPIHTGHIHLFNEAKKLGDQLVVILNNDNWFSIKGRHLFMPEEGRKKIIESLRSVDRVVLSKHKASKKVFDRTSREYSICDELAELKPNIFANGGDRFADDVPEVEVCKKLGIQTVFNVGNDGKSNSSSWLLRDYIEKVNKDKKKQIKKTLAKKQNG